MIAVSSLALLAAGAKSGVAEISQPPAPSGDEVVSEVLASGVRVFIARDPGAGAVAARAAWRGGLRAEPVEQRGLHELLSRSVASGCGDRRPGELAGAAGRIDASIRGTFGRDGFGIRAQWAAGEWERGFELFADCVLAPRFDLGAVRSARRAIQAAHRARAGEPSHHAFRLLAESLFGQHPYALDPLATPESVDRISRRLLAAHYADSYPLGSMVLAIVGDVDPQRVLADLRARFGTAPASSPQKTAAPALPPAPESPRELYRYVAGDRAFVAFGFRGAALGEADRYALEVAAALVSGPTGRLARALDAEGVTPFDFGALSSHGLDAGLFAAYVDCPVPERTAAYRAIERALSGVANEAPAAVELGAAKAELLRIHAIARRRPASRAAAIALHEAYGLGRELAARYASRIQAVTAADVARVAAAYLEDERAVTATVTPRELSPGAARRAEAAGEGAP